MPRINILLNYMFIVIILKTCSVYPRKPSLSRKGMTVRIGTLESNYPIFGTAGDQDSFWKSYAQSSTCRSNG